MHLAVIPARSGSKRIPGKNVRPFRGKPMLAWSIDVAQQSGLFDRILVSTDDPAIAQLARSCGAEAPFVRPQALASDTAPTKPVIAHAVQWCIDNGSSPTAACCIYPCAPGLQASDLQAALDLLQSTQAAFAYPVAQYPHPVQRALRRLPDGHMQFFDPRHELTRTQDLEPAWHDCGQFYWGTLAGWLGEGGMHSSGVGLPLPHWRIVDIDTPDDWQRAELLVDLLGALAPEDRP